MNHTKKLQVFVSSTYTDLKEQRQAAVEAILTAGHIPAGMELFAAGDKSQMEVIKRWIDDSDVFLLILGGRYGSIDDETGKSYIQLEYEYAQEKSKPFFAVVISEKHLEERVKHCGFDVIERENPHLLIEFRKQVLTKLVRFWEDERDIKLAVMTTLSEFIRREDLVGWIPGNQDVDTGALAEEIARLGKENATLREQLAAKAEPLFNGLTFVEMLQILTSEPLNDKVALGTLENIVIKCAHLLGDAELSLPHLLWVLREQFDFKRTYTNVSYRKYLEKLQNFGIIAPLSKRYQHLHYGLTDSGRAFVLQLAVRWSDSVASVIATEAQMAPEGDYVQFKPIATRPRRNTGEGLTL